MTNIEKWPEAFEHGIPKVGGKWRWEAKPALTYTIVCNGGGLAFHDQTEHGIAFGGLDDCQGFTFLGFADSVNQGAAAPQKPLFVKGGRVRLANGRAMGAQAGATATVTEDYDPDGYLQVKWDDGPLRCGQRDGGYFPQDFACIGPPAPLVAQPSSLKAAVQHEGLAIPPQTGTRHEVFEAAAQKWEGAKQFNLAGQNMKQARAALDADLAYDAEADAIRENRIVRKAALQEMGAGDLVCFKLRNLREFEAIKSVEHAKWNWWAR